MNFSQGTPQQKADMTVFRQIQRKHFSANPEFINIIFEGRVMLNLYWPAQDTESMISWLKERSWNFMNPSAWMSEWLFKCFTYAGKGMTYPLLAEGDLFQLEDSLFPIDNYATPVSWQHLELAEFERQARSEKKPSFKQQLAEAIKKGGMKQRRDN